MPSVNSTSVFSEVPGNMRVVASPGCGSPSTLLKHLNSYLDNLQGARLFTRLFSGLQLNYEPFIQSIEDGKLQYSTWHVMPKVRNLVATGKVDYLPARASEVPNLLRKWQTNVALLRLSPANIEGFHSLGPTGSYPVEAINVCPTIFAEIDENVPWVGTNLIHSSQITTQIQSEIQMPMYELSEESSTAQRIANHVIGLIPQSPVIQIGMGSISESIMFSIQKSNLQGIRFVGMGCDPMVDMFHSGQMEKPKDKTDFSILAVELMGTQKIMDFAHNNPAVQVVSSRIGHNSSILSKLDKFVSINSAIEIDLSGQVNSETVDSRQISGIGGSIDYAETAFQSTGGVRITALASTAKKGTVSTIVPRLSSESAVTIPRGLAEFVVTEHGVADLRGKTMKERAENLIRIADPAFRQELEESVNTKGYR